MKGIYLAAYKSRLPGYDLDYNDVISYPGVNVIGDMLSVDLSKYDFVIATPPCNYYSRCNYRRDTSEYSQKTKHLLPEIIKKLINCDKPWIVENVRNSRIFQELGLYDLPCFVYIIGRHTYWTNILLPVDVDQRQDFKNGGYVIKYEDMKNREHQGGFNVEKVLQRFLEVIL